MMGLLPDNICNFCKKRAFHDGVSDENFGYSDRICQTTKERDDCPSYTPIKKTENRRKGQLNRWHGKKPANKKTKAKG